MDLDQDHLVDNQDHSVDNQQAGSFLGLPGFFPLTLSLSLGFLPSLRLIFTSCESSLEAFAGAAARVSLQAV